MSCDWDTGTAVTGPTISAEVAAAHAAWVATHVDRYSPELLHTLERAAQTLAVPLVQALRASSGDTPV